jgi:hypothetical protein
MRLIIRLSLLILVTVSAIGIIYHINPLSINYKTDYLASILDKERTLHKIEYPKIILVGGSNLAFGVNTQRLIDSLNYPVFNNGTHGGLGLSFIINETKPFIKKNDIVVLCLEYYLKEGNYNLIEHLVDISPSCARFYQPVDKIQALKDKTDGIKENWTKKLEHVQSIILNDKTISDNSIYKRSNFNVLGDFIGHLNLPSRTELKDKTIYSQEDYSFYINLLNDFYFFAKNKGARVYFTYPPFPATEYRKSKSGLKFLQLQFKDKLKIPTLTTPENFIFKDEDFFDTVYHLNKEGREKRTDKLIKVLKNVVY